MVKIYPFCGIRYNPKKISFLARVICPPYDIISPEEQEFYHRLHSANVIRLELPKGGKEKYRKAKETYNQWLERKILSVEKQPAFYIYQQTFSCPTQTALHLRTVERTGFFAALKLEPLGKDIYPHEKTFPKPKLDRLELLRNLKANISPVFIVFSDREKKISTFLEAQRNKKSLFHFKDSTGMEHRLWKITEKKKISFLQNVFRKKKLYIADGHHRYETALNYSQEQRGSGIRYPASERILTYLCPLEEEGLIILPTYRVIKGRWDVGSACPDVTSGGRWKEWKKEKEKYFSFILLKDKKEMFSRLKKNLALYFQGKYYLLRLKKEGEKMLEILLPGSSPFYRQLPVTILHNLLLKGVFKEVIIFTQDSREATKLVDKGIGKLAFFFSAPEKNFLQKVAQTHEIMPEKSTYFYPKLPTGLVIYSLEDADKKL